MLLKRFAALRILGQLKPGWIAPFLCLELLLIAYSLGPRISWDGLRDDTFSQILVDTNFDFKAFDERAQMPEPYAQEYFDREFTSIPQSPWLYIVWVLIVAGAKVTLGPSWMYGIVTLNAIAIMLSGLIVMFLARRLLYGPIFAGAIYAVFWDQLYFVPWIQTDPIFNLMAATMFAICARLASAKSLKGQANLCFLMIIFALIATFFRPNGFVLFSFSILAIIYTQLVIHKNFFACKHARLLWVTGILLASSSTLLTLAVFVHDPALWPFGIGHSLLETMQFRTGAGEVVISRLETFAQPPENWLDVAAIHYTKFIYFFAFIGQDFSLFHKVANTLWYIPFYCLVFRGILFALFVREVQYTSVAHLGILAITMIILFASFHAVTLVDFEWRYRVVVCPALVLLATMGLRGLIFDWERCFYAAKQ